MSEGSVVAMAAVVAALLILGLELGLEAGFIPLAGKAGTLNAKGSGSTSIELHKKKTFIKIKYNTFSKNFMTDE